ncbi:hypothetical protein DFS33DRAFT_1352417 [Desarmillaria ectypa]|nr:hypothetical protein DFS33DRAFT_1352417 [Desarmillaria ectypa]
MPWPRKKRLCPNSVSLSRCFGPTLLANVVRALPLGSATPSRTYHTLGSNIPCTFPCGGTLRYLTFLMRHTSERIPKVSSEHALPAPPYFRV